MRSLLTFRRLTVAAALLAFGGTAAQAGDATTLADRAGFLLGHAHRCGVPDAQLQPSVALMEQLIAAYSAGDDDLQSARAEFAEGFVAGAMAQPLSGPLPPCATVRAQLSRLERHRTWPSRPGSSGEPQIAGKSGTEATAAPGGAAPAAKPAATGRQPPQQRAALTLKRAAAASRVRSPSI